MPLELIIDATFQTSQRSDTPICNPPSSDKIKLKQLKQLRNENPFRIIIGHININSVRKKCESLVDIVSANLNVLMISEANTDETFLESKFITGGFSEPHRLDRTVNGGGILLNVRRDICTKCIKGITFSNSFEGRFIELNLRNKIWLLGCSYNAHRDKKKR